MTSLNKTRTKKPSDREIGEAVDRVREVVPNGWQEEDILRVLEDNEYDSSRSASKILDGSAGEPSKWHDVNKKTTKPIGEKSRNQRREGGSQGARRDDNGSRGPRGAPREGRPPRRDDLAARPPRGDDGGARREPRSDERGPRGQGKAPLASAPSSTQSASATPTYTAAPTTSIVQTVTATPSSAVPVSTTTVSAPQPTQSAAPARGGWGKPPSSIFAGRNSAPVATTTASTTPSVTPVVATPVPAVAAPTTTAPTTVATTGPSTHQPAPVTPATTSPVTEPLYELPSTTISSTTTTSTSNGAPSTLTTTPAPTVVPTVSEVSPATSTRRSNEFSSYSATSNLLKQWKPKEATAPITTKPEPVAPPVSQTQESTSPLLHESTSPPLSAPTSSAPITQQQPTAAPGKHTAPAPRVSAFPNSPGHTLPPHSHAVIAAAPYEGHFGHFANFGSAVTTQPQASTTKKTEAPAGYGDMLRNRTSPTLNNFDLPQHESRGEHSAHALDNYNHETAPSTIGLEGDSALPGGPPYPAATGYMPHAYGVPYGGAYAHFDPEMRFYDTPYGQPYGAQPARTDLPGDNKFPGAQGTENYEGKYNEATPQTQPGVQGQPQPQAAGQQHPYYGAPYGYYGAPPYQFPVGAYQNSQAYRYAYGQRGPYPMTYPTGSAYVTSPYNPEELGEYKQQHYSQHMPPFSNVDAMGKGQQPQASAQGQNPGKASFPPTPSAPPQGPASDMSFRNQPADFKSFPQPSHREQQQQQSYYNMAQPQFQGGYGGHPAYHPPYQASQRSSTQYNHNQS